MSGLSLPREVCQAPFDVGGQPPQFLEPGRHETREVLWYSGLSSGVVDGDCPPELDRIDVETLATRLGATYLRTTATMIDAESRTVTTSDDQRVTIRRPPTMPARSTLAAPAIRHACPAHIRVCAE